uniref:Major facilitator superfamily associated domain-containing protein n=1 Tax=Aceria tosichella TaxID=561515 RepID=A0A6G1SFI0_9ACAR
MIFKIHYGLWYGALVGIIPFMFNYASEYTGATGTQHGILYTVLPFIALLAKPFVCSIADRYDAHHHCLLLFIFLTMIGYGSLVIYPFFPDWTSQHKNLVWAFYCFAAFLGNTSMCVVNSIGDSLAINSCTRKNISYGQYRLWGPVGFGLFGAFWGIADQIPHLPPYTPVIILLIVILTINMLLLAFWYDKEEFKVLSAVPASDGRSESSRQHPPNNYGSTGQTNNGQTTTTPLTPTPINGSGGGDHTNNQLSQSQSNHAEVDDEAAKVEVAKRMKRVNLLLQLGREHKSVFVYIFIFTFCGLLTGIHWQFFFKYLQKMADDKKQKFSYIVTLALPVQSLGGELVFFLLASRILKRLGASITLVLCLFSFAARYLLYAYLIPNVNLYWVLLVELFQGPAFGLMYCVLTHQANVYSERIDEIVAKASSSDDIMLRKSLHATLQGILGASFEGLGLGLGAIIGGRAYDADPILMWQIAGFGAMAVSSLYLTGTVIVTMLKRSRGRTTDVELSR